MNIILPLEPLAEAKLMALAEEKGVTADAIVREAIDKILSDSPPTPTRSLRGLLAKYGPAPSADEIDQNRAEMLANFPSTDL